ncbi:MAG: hypothetical protein ACRDD1_07625, partial [Planctomycetia bacterium]
MKSDPCRWEWDEYHLRMSQRLLGAESVATVYFVEVPGGGEQANAKRLDELTRGNFTDLRPWFPNGPRKLKEEEVQRRMDALGVSLWERIDRARRARAAPGNVERSNPFFVGRRQELMKLHDAVGVGTVGVVTAVHGLGGLGKTELASQYANGFADCYPAGPWLLRAEGKKELLPLLGDLAYLPEFDFTPTAEQKNDAELLGREVLKELKKRCEALKDQDRDKGAAALVLLDNVSDPQLLSAEQLKKLPHRDASWLRLLATMRLDPSQLAAGRGVLTTVPLDGLNEDEALELLRDHQPPRDPAGRIVEPPEKGVPGFANPAEEAAAREIARELGGFTLAVEQAAVHLGLNAAELPPSVYLKQLRTAGLASVNELSKDADVAAKMGEKNKQLQVILDATLATLEPMPAALTALRFAALLPPDAVPWPWLKELTTKRHPELADDPANWSKVRRRLTGLRLLPGGSETPMTRIHRLVGAHLRKHVEDEVAEELRRYVGRRADAVYAQSYAPDLWELDAFVSSIPHLLNETLDGDLARDGMFLSGKVTAYRNMTAARTLL